MDFELNGQFDHPSEQVIEAFLSPDFVHFVARAQTHLIGLQLRSERREGERIVREVHYQPRPTFDKLGPKTIPPEWFEFIEHSECHLPTGELRFHNVFCTDKISRRLRSGGSITLEELPDNRCKRHIAASLHLQRLPLWARPLKGMAERMLCTQARELLRMQSALLAQWLESGSGTAGGSKRTAG